MTRKVQTARTKQFEKLHLMVLLLTSGGACGMIAMGMWSCKQLYLTMSTGSVLQKLDASCAMIHQAGLVLCALYADCDTPHTNC